VKTGHCILKRTGLQLETKREADFFFVIPAKAGIQTAHPSSGNIQGPLDSRLRGNDEEKE